MRAAQFAAAVEAQLGYPGNGNGRKSLIRTMDTIQQEEIDYVLDKRIPRSKPTLFIGDPGVGKSYTALAIAAALSNGEALPFDTTEPEAPLRSLIISAEDGAADTIKPRLAKLGADMSMIAIPDDGITPSSINATMIDRMLAEWPAALVIIDPILAYANGRNTDRAADVRGLLGPLALVAEKQRAALLLILHMTKNAQMKALYRGQGSVDFVAISRSVFVFAQDSENPERRLMAHAKSSLAGLQPTIEFFIDGNGSFRWGGETSYTADEALDTGEPKREREAKQLDSAARFLQDILSVGAMPSNEVKEKAIKAGVSWRTVWRAKEVLDVRASKQGREWWWRLQT
jgi:AAA domain